MRVSVCTTISLAFLLLLPATMGTDETLTGPDPNTGAVELVEYYNGTVVSVHAGILLVSPDQLGDVERWFYVHEDTALLTFDLVANDDLYMYLFPPGCHDWACAPELTTSENTLTHTIEDPAVGGWEIVFFKRDIGAGSIDYGLTLTKTQTVDHEIEEERYDGSAVAINAGAVLVSPDQLGDVYREFWVREGVETLTIEVETTEDIYFKVGQSNPSRDSSSEDGWNTAGGTLTVTYEAPQACGWYFIIFAETGSPGVHFPEYSVQVTKEHASE
jgi:hypothetical protein